MLKAPPTVRLLFTDVLAEASDSVTPSDPTAVMQYSWGWVDPLTKVSTTVGLEGGLRVGANETSVSVQLVAPRRLSSLAG